MAFKASTRVRATEEIYPELQRAYDVFNQKLNRGKATLGYFSPARFVRFDGQLTHEISMNPAYFASRPYKATLSTLAHEMVHLWQFVIGSPSGGGYHNREWAAMMEAIGLMPSVTGQPGGARVGVSMDHYIIAGGLFDHTADALIEEGFVLSWVDRFPAEVPVGLQLPPDYAPPDVSELAGLASAPAVSSPSGVATISALRDALEDGEAIEILPLPPARLPEPALAGVSSALSWPSDQRNGAIKVKYRCPCCHFQVWGKSGGDLQCNRCDRAMEEIAEHGTRRPAPAMAVNRMESAHRTRSATRSLKKEACKPT